jgi:hypothetical protein
LRTSAFSILLIAFVASGLVFVEVLPYVGAQIPEIVNGIITSDATWTKANSPYTLTGPVAVNDGVTLTIEPGVIINLESYYIRVNGTFIAKGTSSDKIYFNSNSGESATIAFWSNSTGWDEQTGSGSIIQNAVLNVGLGIVEVSPKIENNSLNKGISISGGSPLISNNRIVGTIMLFDDGFPIISGNDIKGLIFGHNGGNVIISSNTITGDYSDAWDGGGIGCLHAIITNNIIKNFQYGIRMAAGNLTIQNNIISDNTIGIQVGHPAVGSGTLQVTILHNLITDNSKGISITDLSPRRTNSTIIIQNNNIQNNKAYNFYSSVPFSIDAPNNWWGTTDAKAINQTIHDNKNDFNLGAVNFVPFLTAPDTQASTALTVKPTATPMPTTTLNQTSDLTSNPQNPTATPQLPNTQNGVLLGFDWEQTAIILLCIGFVVLVFALVFSRKRDVK